MIYINGIQISEDKLSESDLRRLLVPAKLHILPLNISMNQGDLGGTMSSYVQPNKERKSLGC